jgi:hypothetical protein
MARLGDLLADACEGGVSTPGARGEPSEALAKRVALLWPDVVGDEAAANSRPLRLWQGRLSASASSAAWAQTLQFLAGTVAGRLNERLGNGVVREVVFRHAGWEEDPVARARDNADRRDEPTGALAEFDSSDARSLSAEQIRALDEVEGLDLDPELKRRIASAMRLAFVRGQQDSVR